MSRSRQYTRKELETLRRADLQTLYKIHGLRGANARTEALIDELDTFYRTKFVPPASPNKRPGTAASRQLKPIPDQSAKVTVPATAAAAKATTGTNGAKRRPLPSSQSVPRVKSADGLSDGSRLNTASSASASAIQDKLNTLSDRITTLDARLSEPSSSGLASEVTRLKAEVERLEAELREVRTSQEELAAQVQTQAEEVLAALKDRDETWSAKLRDAEIEWEGRMGRVEARWEARFARLEEAQKAHSRTAHSGLHTSTSSALGKRPAPVPTTASDTSTSSTSLEASVPKRPRTMSSTGTTHPTDHSAIREQVRAAARRSCSPTKSPSHLPALPRTPSPTKGDANGSGEGVFKTPELPSGVRAKRADIGPGQARSDAHAAFAGPSNSDSDSTAGLAAANAGASTPSGPSAAASSTSALGIEPRTPSPGPFRNALLPDNALTPSTSRSPTAYGPDFFANLPRRGSIDEPSLPFPIFATTPKPATSAPRSPTLDAPPSASSKRRAAASALALTPGILGRGTPYGHARKPSGGLGVGSGRKVSETVTQAHAGLMGVTLAEEAGVAGGSRGLGRYERGLSIPIRARSTSTHSAHSAQSQGRARSQSMRRSVSSRSYRSVSASGDDEGEALQGVIEEADDVFGDEIEVDESADTDVETPRPRRVISTDYAFPPHLRLGELDADGPTGMPRLSPSPSITETRFTSLPFPHPAAHSSSSSSATGGPGLQSNLGVGVGASALSAHVGGHGKNRSISATTTASDASHVSHDSTRSERSARSSSPTRDFMFIAQHGGTFDESPSAKPPVTPSHRTLLGTERYRDTKYGDLPLVSWATPGEMDLGSTPRGS